jgi:signal peptidase II
MTTWRKRLLWLLVPLALISLDQVSKLIVREQVGQYDKIEIIDGLFRINHVQNRGAAFGIFSDVEDGWRELLILSLNGVALLLVIVYSLRLSPGEWISQLGLHMIFAGAIGNLIDRFTIGWVTDFLEFYWGGWRWPAFNVADSAIVLGVCLLLLDTFRPHRKKEVPSVEGSLEAGAEEVRKQGGVNAS